MPVDAAPASRSAVLLCAAPGAGAGPGPGGGAGGRPRAQLEPARLRGPGDAHRSRGSGGRHGAAGRLHTPGRPGAGHRPARGDRRGGQAQRLSGGAGGDRPAAAQLRVALCDARRVPGVPQGARRGPGRPGRGARPGDPDREVHRGSGPPPLAGARERGAEGLGRGQGRADLGGGARSAPRADATGAGLRARPGGARPAADVHPGADHRPARGAGRGTSWGSGRRAR